MARRKRIYYPDQQIETSLFTRGKEWMYLDTWEEYVGYYHRYNSTGEVFSGGSWDAKRSKALVPYKEKDPSYYRYIDLVNYSKIAGEKVELFGPVKLDRYSAPRAVIREPDDIENRDGIMTRYFLFKRNEKNTKNPIEIDKKQADTYPVLNYGINQHLYELVEIPWKIKGPEFDVYNESGILLESGIVNTNERIVEVFSRKFPILRGILTNYRQFSRFE